MNGGIRIRKAWIIPILWLLTQGCFSLITFENYNPILIIVMVFILVFCLYPSISKKIYITGDPFNYFFILFILLQLVEIIQCTITFDQPIVDTLKRVVWVLPCILYFPIRYVISKDSIWIQKRMIFFGTLACIIGIGLKFNTNLLKYFTADVGIRDGNQYIFFGNKLPLVSTFLIINELFKNRKNKKGFLLFLLGLHIFDFIYVMRFRGQMIGILVAVVVAFLATNELKTWKKCLIIFLVITVIIFTDNALHETIVTLINQLKLGSSTVGVRYDGYNFMISQWGKNIIAGHGGTLLNAEYNKLLSASGYIISDLGIVGWIYKYGLIGLGFYIYYIYLLIKCSSIVIGEKRYLNYIAITFVGYTLSTIMTLTTLDYYQKGNFYVNIFMLALVSEEYIRYKSLKHI